MRGRRGDEANGAPASPSIHSRPLPGSLFEGSFTFLMVDRADPWLHLCPHNGFLPLEAMIVKTRLLQGHGLESEEELGGL